MQNSNQNRIPLGLKVAFSLFMAVLVPFYWQAYGPTNFLYFCDIALFLTLVGMWREDAKLISAAAIGILIPQIAWVIDFVCVGLGFSFLGLTEYMYRESIPLFARGLSLFHGWLPFLLLYLLKRTGFQASALIMWTLIAWAAMLISFWFMPAPGDLTVSPNTPVNINYVYGFSETSRQTWLPDHQYLMLLMLALPIFVYWPSTRILNKLYVLGGKN